MRAINNLQAATSSGEMNVAKLRYVPEYSIAINGEKIPATLRASITSLTYQTGLEGADRVEISLVNENLRWLDHNLLKLDNKLELAIGYAPDPLERVFVGEIVGQNASFPASGGPTLTVVAQDRMYRLQQNTKNRWFQVPAPGVDNFPLPDFAIGSFISLENRLLPTIDLIGAALSTLLGGLDAASVALGQAVVRKQQDESDADFLQRIARSNGLEMFIDHGGRLGGHKTPFYVNSHAI
jgi:phage protein D